ncbi:MAG: TRAP transporter small permease [Spirochaetes bacterium]|nr:TRAP transporter small permease [Spirochaetota bacterium]
MERNGSKGTTIEKLLALVEYLSMGTLVLLALLILLQIALRNLFSIAFAWLDELARWFQVSMVYLSVPLLAHRSQLLEVDSFVKLVSPAIQERITFFSRILSIGFSIAFLWSGYILMGKAGTVKTPALGLPNYLFFAPVFLGMGLLGLVIARTLLARERSTK